MTYFCIGSIPGAINNAGLFVRGQHGPDVWVPALVNIIQVLISGWAVYSIWRLKLSGLKWLWAEVVFSGLMIVLTFLSTDVKTLVAGGVSLVINTLIGLLMVSGYREVLKRHQQSHQAEK